jgi:nucleoredoxin
MTENSAALEALLGNKIIGKDTEQDSLASSLANKKNIILYFSAHWCPPCRGFTPVLSEAYAEYKKRTGDAADAELLFVSWDKDDESFNEYHNEMSFPAIPYDKSLGQSLGEKFGVEGIPTLVVLDASGNPVHKDDSSVDPRGLIAAHGASAFPLSVERISELKVEAAAKSAVALQQLHDGTVKCRVSAPQGGEVSLTDLLNNHDHIGLVFGDGDSTDCSYAALAQARKKLNEQKAGLFEVVYFGWKLYDPEDSDHAPLAKEYHSVLDVSDELRAVLKTVAGGDGSPTLIILRRGSGTCGMDGKCEAVDVPVLVAVDQGMQRVIEGASAYPWSDAAMAKLEEAKKARLEALRGKQANFSFFKGEGGDVLVGKDGNASADLLTALGDDGVVGIYFSAHWCPPCRGFTPTLVETYESLKATGKKFEVVFVSSDQDKDAFESYFASMVTTKADQWLALDYEQRDLKADLSELFEVNGIPTLVLLKPDGSLITKDGCKAVSYGAEYFPWDDVACQRGAAEVKERAAKAKALAVQKEKECEDAQRASGGIVVKRLRGEPSFITHDIAESNLHFSNFATVGAPENVTVSGVLYYEIEVLDSQGVAQFGFALADGMSLIDHYCNDGVGDDTKSWGVDGTRQCKWHDGDSEWPVEFAVGDVFGLAANIDTGKIAVSKNGDWGRAGCGVVFENEAIKSGVFPCFTAGGFELRYRFKDFKYARPAADVWK